MEANTTPTAWSPALPAEQSGPNGTYYRDFALDGPTKFVRLKVTSPVPW